MPARVLSAFHTRVPVPFQQQCEADTMYFHLIREKTETERSSLLPKVTQVGNHRKNEE